MTLAPAKSVEPFRGPADHLTGELERLALLVEIEVVRLRAASLFNEDPLRGLYIPDDQIAALLHHHGGTGREAADLQARAETARRTLDAREAQSAREGIALPLAHLVTTLGLTAIERDALLVAVAPEIDLRYETLYAYVQNDVTKKRPTVDLALRLLGCALEDRLVHRASFTGGAALIRHALVCLVDDAQDRSPPLPARYLKADELVVRRLLGDGGTLSEWMSRGPPGPLLRDLVLPTTARTRLEAATRATPDGLWLLLRGPEGVGRRTAAAAVAAAWGRPLLVIDLGRAVTATQPPQWVARLVREARLDGAALHLAVADAPDAESRSAAALEHELLGALRDSGLPVFVGAGPRWRPGELWRRLPLLEIELPRPGIEAREQLWEGRLFAAGVQPAGDLGGLATAFQLTAGQITTAVDRARAGRALDPPANGVIDLSRLAEAARSASTPALSRLAQKIDDAYTWDDIVLPRRQIHQLREIHDWVAHRRRVHHDWGFARRLTRGLGTNVLFAGKSGTGKTMAACILACELGLDLYKIDLATVVSKYIGETEKNLGRIFDEAQVGNCVLLFDEADALFGKRSEIKDAHDRYANIEVAYLLQRMEEYDGVVILTTNLSKNIDDAFARRMHHQVDFPFPDAGHRERIWRRLFPTEAPLGTDVDLAFVARQFELSGGNIRNVALASAFLAAASGNTIEMVHLMRAVSRELVKLGQVPTRAGFREYYELVRDVRA